MHEERKDKYLSVHEVAELTGTTARTLHYYDEIALLKPALVTDAGYRQYSKENLLHLQEILFLREVGFSLKEIKALMESPGYDTGETERGVAEFPGGGTGHIWKAGTL